MIENNQLIEYACYVGNYYGTPKEYVEKMLDEGKDVILEMHKSGLSILEIAKHLGLGVGEVKLVVDLYQGESK